MGEPIDRSQRVFDNFMKFEKIFPQLEDVTLEWTEAGNGIRRYSATEKMPYEYKVSMREHSGLIHCNNGLCRYGGFELDFIIRDMIQNKETVKEGSRICSGQEMLSKKISRKCLNSIQYRITLIYKKT